MRYSTRTFSFSLLATAVSTSSLLACSAGVGDGSEQCPDTTIDANCDLVHDQLGVAVIVDGKWAEYDFDGDGEGDGLAIDIGANGKPDGAGYDSNNDGIVDTVDLDGDGVPDHNVDGPINNGGGGNGNGGGANSGGSMNDTGGTGSGASGGSSTAGSCLEQTPDHSSGPTISGSSDSVRYFSADTTRNGRNYRFIANGWGDNWEYHEIDVGGSKFNVIDFQGTQGANYSPAGYPTVFCGDYSDSSSQECGLPATMSSISEIDTGLRWSHDGTGSDFNVAYDVWMADGSNHVGYLMVWYRDPPGNQPAGGVVAQGVEVPGVDDTWDVWTGQVNGRDIVNYVQPEGADLHELSFDVMDFVDHANSSGYNLPGDTIMSVAIGFEIWNGPVTNLAVEDFCVEVE